MDQTKYETQLAACREYETLNSELKRLNEALSTIPDVTELVIRFTGDARTVLYRVNAGSDLKSVCWSRDKPEMVAKILLAIRAAVTEEANIIKSKMDQL